MTAVPDGPGGSPILGFPSRPANLPGREEMTMRMNELGFYTLAGAPKSPRDLIDEVREAEAMGLGAAFVSERFNVKEAATLCGAAAAVSSQIGIATAVTNHNTRHPMVTAAMAMTMHRMTEGRFTLGLGRGIAMLTDLYGLPRIRTEEMEDFAGLMRRLWKGEMVAGHDGPAGSWPLLMMGSEYRETIPLLLSAFVPASLRLAGRAFDAVVLHTFFSEETTARSVATVRRAAEEAGRDPASIRIWSCFATVGDHLDEELRLRKTVGRMGTYLQGYGDLLVRTNRWDPAVLKRFRESPVVASIPGAIDALATREQLEQIAPLIPEEWLAPSATGSPADAVAAIRGQFDLGCDCVILHGASPRELAPIVEEYRSTRPAGRFDHLPANPGAR
jgi:5,10-methylenetetrahydromethanopterin reductase